VRNGIGSVPGARSGEHEHDIRKHGQHLDDGSDVRKKGVTARKIFWIGTSGAARSE
jgi:hypothetical protein